MRRERFQHIRLNIHDVAHHACKHVGPNFCVYMCADPGGYSYLPWPGSQITSSSAIPAPQLTAISAGGHAEGRGSSSGSSAAAAAAAAGSSDTSSGSSDGVTPDDIVVVDCTHPFLPTLSHHQGANNPAGVKAADTSTGVRGGEGGVLLCVAAGGGTQHQGANTLLTATQQG